MGLMMEPQLMRAELHNPTGEVAYNGFGYAFNVFDNHRDYNDLVRWCEDHYGVNDPEAHWYIEAATMAMVTIWFREESQAMEFKLRWV